MRHWRRIRVLLLLFGVAGVLESCGAGSPRIVISQDPAPAPAEPKARRDAPPAPERREPAEADALKLFTMFNPSPMVSEVARRMGYEPIPQINKWRFFDRRSERFDRAEYAQKIWTPDRTFVPVSEGWAQFGIPPGHTGWVDLDFEKWEPIFEPGTHDEAAVEGRVNDYKQLIIATRELRPEAKICLHGLVKGDLSGRRGALIEEIASTCDAVSPSMYMNLGRDLRNLDKQLALKQQWLESALELKRRHGVKVFPVVWKRYRARGGGEMVTDERGRDVRPLLPPEAAAAMLDMIFSTEHEGLRVDGVIVWGNDNRYTARGGDGPHAVPGTARQRDVDDSDLRFLRLIVDKAKEHGHELPGGRQ